MTIELKPEERLDDLQRNGFKIIQNPGKFCFGMDAVLLSGFAKVKQGEKVLDLGTGTGIIPILLAGKTKAGHLLSLIHILCRQGWGRRRKCPGSAEQKLSLIHISVSYHREEGWSKISQKFTLFLDSGP